MAKITVSFTFDDQKFPRLVRWLNSLPVKGKSKAIREVLDAHVSGKELITMGDLHEEIKQIRGILESGNCLVSSSEPKNNGNDEPDDIAEALDNLGL